jgi:hypothetical protein
VRIPAGKSDGVLQDGPPLGCRKRVTTQVVATFSDIVPVSAWEFGIIEVHGLGGPGTPYERVDGKTFPAATIAGVPFGNTQFVGWNGSRYVLKPTLKSFLADDLEPVGKITQQRRVEASQVLGNRSRDENRTGRWTRRGSNIGQPKIIRSCQ